MGQLSFDELPDGLRRALPFVAALVLGLLAWQLPVLAELGDDEAEEVATAGFGVATTSTTTQAPVVAVTTAVPVAPPTTRAMSFRPSSPPPTAGRVTTTTRPPVTTTTRPQTTTTTTAPPITGPLQITKATWGRNAYQPANAGEVPDGVLPVELASYISARQSYIEVRGTDPILTLRLAEAESGPDASPPDIIACEITSQFWNDRSPGAAYEDSPPHDPESCTPGTVNEDGTWSFDVSSFGPLDDHYGFALVPVADGGLGTWSAWFENPTAS